MNTAAKQQIRTPVVRQYEIGGVRYIVKASVSGRASESAVTKINRLASRVSARRGAVLVMRWNVPTGVIFGFIISVHPSPDYNF